MNASPLDLTIIVVSYNTREMTLECLRSVFREGRSASFELRVVDNASEDGSAASIQAEFPQVELFSLEENLGFAGANNMAAVGARGEFLLLLNPDTVVLDGAIDEVLRFARRRPEAGIWGGRTVYEDGRLNQGSCWAAPSIAGLLMIATGLANRIQVLNLEAMGTWQRDSEREVDIVSGCFLLIRTDLWQSLEGFDSSFFMYGEDADLCLRGRDLGARPAITPAATLVHHGGASERVKADKLVRLFKANAQLFARYWGPRKGWVGVALLDLWAWLRVLLLSPVAWVSPGRRASASEWRSVLGRRHDWRHAFRAQRDIERSRSPATPRTPATPAVRPPGDDRLTR